MSLNTMVYGLRDGREQAGVDEDLGAFISRLASLLLYLTWTWILPSVVHSSNVPYNRSTRRAWTVIIKGRYQQQIIMQLLLAPQAKRARVRVDGSHP
jgi:hypothetical protein